jgi:hypothetical protein
MSISGDLGDGPLLATNFPSIRQDVNRAIRNNINPALLGLLRPDEGSLSPTSPKSATQIARVSAFDVLRDPDLPVTHILLTSRSETHISEAFQNEESPNIP